MTAEGSHYPVELPISEGSTMMSPRARHRHLDTQHDGLTHETLENFLAWRDFELSRTKLWQPGDPWPPGWEPEVDGA